METQLRTELEEKLAARCAGGKLVMVGLDPNQKMLKDRGTPNEASLRSLTMEIVEATLPHAAAFKPNLNFYLRMGSKGIEVLEEAVRHIRHRGCGVPVVLDSKSNDIDSSAMGYAEFAFDVLGADGMTWNPYLGLAAYANVFERYSRKFFAVLCKTSNGGAEEFQNLPVESFRDSTNGKDVEVSLYQTVAGQVSRHWPANCGLVYGATRADSLGVFRAAYLAPETLLLIPGVGAQGGDLEKSVHYGQNSAGLVLLNVGRGIIAPELEEYQEGERYPDVVARKTQEYNQQIAAALVGPAEAEVGA